VPHNFSKNAHFFIPAQYGAFLLIINVYVGSFASHHFPKLRKNFPLLLTFFPPTWSAGKLASHLTRSECFRDGENNKIIVYTFCTHFLQHQYKLQPRWQRGKKKIYDRAFCVV
jgi:hypothetical protein